ncbi:MAG: NIPSNAP family protein [Verrucomicrobiota bacterium]
MNTTLLTLTMAAGTLSILAADPPAASPKPKDARCYEMRTYDASPGKLEDLNARFRNHTIKLFEKHGMVNVGYWVPVNNPDNQLIYILAYPSREAREASWKAFFADPDWQAAQKASEVNGRLVAKVDSTLLTATDYSPVIASVSAPEPRVFELRTYLTPPGRLDALNARFRDHTVALFQKHGIINIGYWTKMQDQKEADTTLIYILAHKSREAAAASFKAFGADPDWIAARKASEEKAGGSLTAPNGVKSVFMTATDYSAIK